MKKINLILIIIIIIVAFIDKISLSKEPIILSEEKMIEQKIIDEASLLEDYKLVKEYGTEDSDSECIPSGITLDKEGNIYVTNLMNNYIKKFNNEGKLLDKLDIKPFGITGIKDIAIDSEGNIYAVSRGKIYKFNSDGHLITRWGNTGCIENFAPDNIAICPDNYIYISNYQDICKFSSQGEFITKWTLKEEPYLYELLKENAPNSESLVYFITGIALDSKGCIFAVYSRIFIPAYSGMKPYYPTFVVKYTSSGKLISKWRFLSYYANEMWLGELRGITIDSEDNIFISSSGLINNYIYKFDSEMNFLTRFGHLELKSEKVSYPENIATDKDGNLYAYYCWNCIQKFAPNPEFKETNQ